MFNREEKEILNNPFKVFEIKNFLNNELYNNLKNNFPLTSDNSFNQYYESIDNGKFYFTSDNKLYHRLKTEYDCMLEFENIVFSKSFFDFFFKKLFFSFLKSSNFKRFFKLLRIPRLSNNRETMNFKNFLFNNVSVRIEYSYLVNNALLRPHTDNKNKLLSLMLYFPEENNDLLSNDIESSLGTQFWLNHEPNYKNFHINDIENFERNSHKIYKPAFERNLLVGFVRNKYSWHSIQKLIVPDKYVRRSININFFI